MKYISQEFTGNAFVWDSKSKFDDVYFIEKGI